jgi:hypothetical protein
MPFLVTCPSCRERVACYESRTPYVIYCPTCAAPVTAPSAEPAPRRVLVLPDSAELFDELGAPEPDGPTRALHPVLVYVMLVATVALAFLMTL